ncbi:MAG: FkbM family methyltransferase [Bacteroidetes bacterium]|nr:FkbM family methyltransferase [Bacteroidota bacterium]
MNLRKWVAHNFPGLGSYKRYATAFLDRFLPVKKSYSQHQEDIYILSLLKKYNTENAIYVDVGANHPTDISNTYLLYRNGMKGILFEPNEELSRLAKNIGSQDIVLPIAISSQPELLKFNISKTPVLSSFKELNHTFYKSVYIPVLPLDLALKHIEYQFISLLSIDVEGLNIDVLKGARDTIQKALIICIEFDSKDEQFTVEEILGVNFKLISVYNCNLIYLNSKLSEELISYSTAQLPNHVHPRS